MTPGRWARRRLLRRCRALAGSLDLPVPFDAAELAVRVADRRRRPIELIPTPWQPGLPCGLLVTADQADYIVYAADTPPLHRQHILAHELAHLLCEHRGRPSTGLLPHLSPQLVGRVLGRTVYSEPQEQEAELLASLMLHRALWSRPAPATDPFFDPAPRRDGHD
ncbi:ParH-like protein [Streptomyces sp. NPDC052396]|uniref:ParH-like protein n=1 Tax=Streptomyces sp. NPDC052396 TaxID=3365689 RepID=UPI0037CF29B0